MASSTSASMTWRCMSIAGLLVTVLGAGCGEAAQSPQIQSRGGDEPIGRQVDSPDVGVTLHPGIQFTPVQNATAGVRILSSSKTAVAQSVPLLGADPLSQTKIVVQTPHLHAVRAVAFHPQGRFLASVSTDSTLKLWDLRTGRLMHTFAGATAPLYAVAFSPDGNWLVAGGADKDVQVWDVRTRKHVDRLRGHSGWVQDLAFNGDGSLLASASKDKFVVVWDFKERVAFQTFDHPKQVFGVGLSKDGALVATADQQHLRIWNVEKGTVLFETPLPGRCDRVLFSQDDKYVYAGFSRASYAEEDEVQDEALEITRETLVVDLAKKVVKTIPDRCLDYSPAEGLLVHLNCVGRLSFRDPLTGESKRSIVVPNAPTPEQVLAERNADSLLDADFPRWHAPDETARVSPDGSMVASSDLQGWIGVWDARTGKEVRTLGGRAEVPYGLGGGNMMRPLLAAWNPQGPQLASAGMDGKVRFFDLRGDLAPVVVEAHNGSVTALAFSTDGRTLATSGQDRQILLWDAATSAVTRTIDYSQVAGDGYSLAFSPDGKILACGHQYSEHGDGCTTLWSPQTGERLAVLNDKGPTKGSNRMLVRGMPINALAFIDNGASLVAARGFASRISRFEMATFKQATAAAIGEEQIHDVTATRDGKLFAIAYGRYKFLDQITTSYPVNEVLVMGEGAGFSLAGHEGNPTSVSFSPDGKLLTSGSSDGQLFLWDLEKREAKAAFQAHDADVDSVAFSHDGRFIASAGRDMTIRIWDVEQLKLAAAIVAVNGTDYVVVTPEGNYASSRDALSAVALRTNDGAMPMDLFDAVLNRPDRVLIAFGYAPPDVIALYEAACQRRSTRLGLSAVASDTQLDAPSITLLDHSPPSSEDRLAKVSVKATSSHSDLRYLKTYVNDVPVGLADGFALQSYAANQVTAEIEVPLGSGVNKIQISVADDEGVESLPTSLEVTCTDPAQPRLFIAALGVSNYAQAKLKLKYAAKDATDVANAFEESLAGCTSALKLVRVDSQVHRGTLAEVRNFFEQSTVDDVAVLFIAGHGFLDSKMDYWFATHDIDSRRPSERGISFAELEGLFDGVPARRRLFLIDTCHAGEADDLPAEAFTNDGPSPDAVADLLQTMFVDLRRSTGTTIIAGATAEGKAYEDGALGNGYFTFALLEGLLKQNADRNNDNQVKVSELRDYILKRVPELGNKLQRPRVRRENSAYDFRLN